eukprot:scaffold1521_cov271-Chaetoceros_neogracile.AAC.95
MEEEKIQRLHDSLSKLRRGKGLGTNSHFSWNASESIPMDKDKDGNLFRTDGLPVNGLYSNFVKQGTYDPNKAEVNSALKYGDGRKIKRNFDDIKSINDEDTPSSSSKKKSKEERKIEKKEAKLEAKKQAKLEEKKHHKLEAKKAAKKLEKSGINVDDATSKSADEESKKAKKKAKKKKEKFDGDSGSSSKKKKDTPSSVDKDEKKSKKKKKDRS